VEKAVVGIDRGGARLADDTVTAMIHPPGDGRDIEKTFSRKFACPDCGVSYPEISPRLFSFNSPHGACPQCGGLGRSTTFDPVAMVVDAKASIAKGAIGPWGKRLREKYGRAIARLVRAVQGSARRRSATCPRSFATPFYTGPTSARSSV
jgi:excinuclease ABC subunit A